MTHEPETYEFQRRCAESLKPWHADVLFEFDTLVRENRRLRALADGGEKHGRIAGLREAGVIAKERATTENEMYEVLKKLASNPDEWGVLKHAARAGEAERIRDAIERRTQEVESQ